MLVRVVQALLDIPQGHLVCDPLGGLRARNRPEEGGETLLRKPCQFGESHDMNRDSSADS